MPAVANRSFTLAGIQQDMYYDDRRFLVAVAGRNGGKTTAACMRILGMINRGEIKRGARILVIAPDYTQLKDGTLKSFDRWFGDYEGSANEPPGAGLIRSKINGNVPMRYLVNDIEVMFRSGMNPDQTRSKECQIVWLDEAAQLTEQLFTLTNANLRQFGNNALYQTIITTTPRGKNWIYRRFGLEIEACKRGQNESSNTGAYHITTVEAEAQGIVRKGYVEELGYEPGSQIWEQEVMAEFVAWTGLVFNQNFEIVPALPKMKVSYGGVDYGNVSPSAVEIAGSSEGGAVYMYGEKYQPRMQLHDLVSDVAEKHQVFHVRKWAADNDVVWRMINNAGVPCRPPYKKKDAANIVVGYVNSLIARGQFKIHESCRALIHEMQTYEFKDLQSGDEVTFLDKVKPNQFDHAIDAMRYAILPLSAAGAAQSYGKEVGFAYA